METEHVGLKLSVKNAVERDTVPAPKDCAICEGTEVKFHTLATALLTGSFSGFSYFHANLIFIFGII
jgi:hypothetical protein